jgi:tetratricopeptide (TPR) repeat protein
VDQKQFSQINSQEDFSNLTEKATRRFIKVSKRYARFHWAFMLLGLVELICFFLFLASWSRTSILAINLGVIFLTAFTYFVLRLYFQARKPEQLLFLRNEYLEKCKSLVAYREGVPDHHLLLARIVCKFVMVLHEKEYSFYRFWFYWPAFTNLLEKISCWWHWKDVHVFRELLLFSSVDEHIKLVKCEPTNLEFHAALANAYVMLSNLYHESNKYEDEHNDRWVPPEKYSKEMFQKFRKTAQRAVEELKILNDYAPNDPWVHVQLAYNYHDLQMPEEEIREYETILSLCPDDKDTLFKLGMLYFQQGLNAKGLRAYERLKRSHYRKAEDLIKFYGAYASQDTCVHY